MTNFFTFCNCTFFYLSVYVRFFTVKSLGWRYLVAAHVSFANAFPRASSSSHVPISLSTSRSFFLNHTDESLQLGTKSVRAAATPRYSSRAILLAPRLANGYLRNAFSQLTGAPLRYRCISLNLDHVSIRFLPLPFHDWLRLCTVQL